MKTLFLLATCTATASAQTSPLVRAEGWRHLFDPEPTDPGTGVIAFAAPRQSAWADTLRLFARPADTEPVGLFLFASDGAGGWTYAIEWQDTLSTNLFEYG